MIRLFLLAFAACLLSSCHLFHQDRVQGNGHSLKQDRHIDGFTSLDLNSAVKVYISQGSTESVFVEADSNLQSYIEVVKKGDVLQIHQKNNSSISSENPVKVYVTVTSLNKISLSGASQIIGETVLRSDDKLDIVLDGASSITCELQAASVNLKLNGASTASLKGNVTNFNVDASGASTVDSFNLLTENAKVDLDGASSAEISASKKIDSDANGASNVTYKGSAVATHTESGASGFKQAGQ